MLLGCVVSVGGLTESLVVHAGETLANFFHKVTEDENQFQRVAEATLNVGSFQLISIYLPIYLSV